MKQWGITDTIKIGDENKFVKQSLPVAITKYLCGQATVFANTDIFNTNQWTGCITPHIQTMSPTAITLLVDTVRRDSAISIQVEYIVFATI